MVIKSQDAVDDHYNQLGDLKVVECSASHGEDKEYILSKINEVDIFNSQKQTLIFGASNNSS